jgi:hypothetical protein
LNLLQGREVEEEKKKGSAGAVEFVVCSLVININFSYNLKMNDW